MAIFGLGKKKETKPIGAAPPVPGAPIDQVIALKQEGYSDQQIMQSLQAQGFNAAQVQSALSQFNATGPQFQQSQQNTLPQMTQFQQYQPQDSTPFQQQQPQEQDSGYAGADMSERIEELTEAIVDEKWKELVSDIQRIIDWKDKSERRLTQVEQQLTDVRATVESIHRSLLSKISQYDQNISNVGTEIKAMEKVFQKVLPNLTENVNKLDRLTKRTSSR